MFCSNWEVTNTCCHDSHTLSRINYNLLEDIIFIHLQLLMHRNNIHSYHPLLSHQWRVKNNTVKRKNSSEWLVKWLYVCAWVTIIQLRYIPVMQHFCFWFPVTSQSIQSMLLLQVCDQWLNCSSSFVEDVVEPLQNRFIFMQPRGVHEYIMDHISNPDNRISVQAMAFLTALMWHGNRRAQKLIRLCIQSTNTGIFSRMDNILSLTSSHIETISTRS